MAQSTPSGSNRSEGSAFSRFAAGETGLRETPFRRNVVLRWVMLGLTTLLLLFLFPHGSQTERSREAGSLWSGDTVRASFSFPLLKDPSVYNAEVQRARDSTLPVFLPNDITLASVRDSLRDVIDRLDSAALAAPESNRSLLTKKSRSWIASLDEGSRKARLDRIVGGILASLEDPFRRGVIDRNRSTIPFNRIVLRKGAAVEEELSIAAIYDSVMVMQRLDADLATRGIEEEEYALAIDLVEDIWRPSYRYSPELTAEAADIAANAVPRTGGLVRQGQIIVTPGEQINESTALMLQSYDRSQRLQEDRSSLLLKFLGALGHVIILLGLPLIYLYNFRPRIFNDNLQLGIILATIVMVSLMAWISIILITPLPIEYLILIPFLSTLMAILFDSRTAFYLTVVACLFVAGVRGADYTVAIALLSAGVLAAYTVRDIKNRTQLYRSIAFSIFGFSLAIFALGLERGATLGQMGLELGFAGVNAIVSPVLTFGAIFVLEYFFNVATDLKLLEYDDLNHPLLKMLADKAPGTYQHTLTIARLAEAAASAIGANALQAKVGSYFHDIGKVTRSEYFVENQMGMDNKHDKIKPEQSVKVIREHVIDGIRIARKYGLPERIVDFIPTHHGTTTIKYFYDKAREVNPDVDIDLFRYPGPLPHTRETAIVMLADAVEATSRSLPDPNPSKIKETVDQIIKRRFSDGQLDRCDLTLADLTKIREAFVKNLVGMAHPRIQYKKEKEEGGEGGPPETGAQVDLIETIKKAGESEPPPYIDDAFGGLGVDAKSLKAEKRSPDTPDEE